MVDGYVFNVVIIYLGFFGICYIVFVLVDDRGMVFLYFVMWGIGVLGRIVKIICIFGCYLDLKLFVGKIFKFSIVLGFFLCFFGNVEMVIDGMGFMVMFIFYLFVIVFIIFIV